MLFNLYISELIDQISIITELTPVYADDIACITISESTIKKVVQIIHNWSINNKINLNPRKSGIVLFNRKSKNDK